LFIDDMSRYPVGTCISEGRTVGNIKDVFNGYGSACIVDAGAGKHVLDLRPHVSTSPAENHSTLATTGASFGRRHGYVLTADYRTVAQQRTGSAPNPWEVGWLLWDYSDNDHFYSLVLKRNGWEIDKEYRDVNGRQRQHFATAIRPQFRVGDWYRVIVAHTSSRGVARFSVKVSVNGGRLRKLATITDRGKSRSGPAYTSGKIGFNAEDSEAWYGSLRVTGCRRAGCPRAPTATGRRAR
jgi:hypothetical protein